MDFFFSIMNYFHILANLKQNKNWAAKNKYLNYSKITFSPRQESVLSRTGHNKRRL